MKTPQSPAPVAGRPLTAEDVALLRKGDVLRRIHHGEIVTFFGKAVFHPRANIRVFYASDAIVQGNAPPCAFTFIGRPDSEGWMPWAGGENPVPGQMVDYRWMEPSFPAQADDPNVQEGGSQLSDKMDWQDIIAFRLSRPASDQPVGAIGAGREEATARVAEYTARGAEDLGLGEVERLLEAATLLAALSPASPARTPMGEPVAWIERQNDGTRYGEPKRWPPSDRARSYAQEMGRTIEPLYAAASPARTPMGGPQVLKGVGKINGDDWKDTTTIGEVVYVWNAEKPSPYAPGQYPRIDNEGWSASTAQYDFSPASVDEVRALAAPTPMGGEAEFEIVQEDGEWCAGTSGPRDRALADARHYAAVYGQDGPVVINEIIRRPVQPVEGK